MRDNKIHVRSKWKQTGSTEAETKIVFLLGNRNKRYL